MATEHCHYCDRDLGKVDDALGRDNPWIGLGFCDWECFVRHTANKVTADTLAAREHELFWKVMNWLIAKAKGGEFWPQSDSGIHVDYPLLDKQLKTLGDAITFLNEDASPEGLDRIEGAISVEHLEGLYWMCCVIYEKRPFSEWISTW